jgi:multidrug efflux pump subunit AcrB
MHGADTSSYLSISVRMPRGEELERVDEFARFFEERLRQMPEIDRFITRVSTQNAAILVFFPDELENTSIPSRSRRSCTSTRWGSAAPRCASRATARRSTAAAARRPTTASRCSATTTSVSVRSPRIWGARLTAYSRIREVDTNSAGSWFERDRVTELVVDIDRTRLAMHDLTAADVVRQVASAVRGRTSNNTIRLGGEERSSP